MNFKININTLFSCWKSSHQQENTMLTKVIKLIFNYSYMYM